MFYLWRYIYPRKLSDDCGIKRSEVVCVLLQCPSQHWPLLCSAEFVFRCPSSADASDTQWLWLTWSTQCLKFKFPSLKHEFSYKICISTSLEKNICHSLRVAMAPLMENGLTLSQCSPIFFPFCLWTLRLNLIYYLLSYMRPDHSSTLYSLGLEHSTL